MMPAFYWLEKYFIEYLTDLVTMLRAPIREKVILFYSNNERFVKSRKKIPAYDYTANQKTARLTIYLPAFWHILANCKTTIRQNVSRILQSGFSGYLIF